jgi:hypothetical protein
MNSFEVDENGFTEDGYRRLEGSAVPSMYAGNAIGIAVALALLASYYLFFERYVTDFATEIGMVLCVVIAVYIAYLLVSPIVFFRRYRYRIDDDKVEIRRGVFVVSHTLVPIERIHQVEVSQGPINRHFGLADLTMTTAGGVVAIQYLEKPVAEDIAEKLNETVIGILKERSQDVRFHEGPSQRHPRGDPEGPGLRSRVLHGIHEGDGGHVLPGHHRCGDCPVHRGLSPDLEED